MVRIILLCALLLPATLYARNVKPSEEKENNDPCANVYCRAGQECIIEEGNATCQCISRCPDHKKTVCGSDGITYPSHCELHRTACVMNKKIAIETNGPCADIYPTQPPTGKVHKSKPVVCYEHNRDDLRNRLILWLKFQGEVVDESDGDHDIFKKYFDAMDEDKNAKLSRKEFAQLIKSNDTVAQMPGADQFINPVLQGLCADALIAISDEDADWELTFHEFMKCVDPAFKPPKERCELEGEYYNDGAEIPAKCNTCVCACGHWVCTALNCDCK